MPFAGVAVDDYSLSEQRRNLRFVRYFIRDDEIITKMEKRNIIN